LIIAKGSLIPKYPEIKRKEQFPLMNFTCNYERLNQMVKKNAVSPTCVTEASSMLDLEKQMRESPLRQYLNPEKALKKALAGDCVAFKSDPDSTIMEGEKAMKKPKAVKEQRQTAKAILPTIRIDPAQSNFYSRMVTSVENVIGDILHEQYISEMGELLKMVLHEDTADIFIRYKTNTEADNVIPSGFGKVAGNYSSNNSAKLWIKWGPSAR
jgi:hypothetical protein